jgi:xanthine dehydrogenase accessory factor
MTYFEIARELEQEGCSFVVVTQIAQRGETPSDLGAKAIITREGLRWGTVGGGKIEARAIENAHTFLDARQIRPAPVTVVWNLQKDVGMTCGGEVTLLFEVHAFDAWNIVIFGAGHVAQALVRALAPLSCQVHCIDSREQWVRRLPDQVRLKKQTSNDPAQLVPIFHERSFFVVMTQGHATDVPVLAAILKNYPDAPFVGAIGSDIKGIKIRSELRELGFSDPLVNRIKIPIGLPIGSNEPAEIAISIIAQLLEVRGSSR